jgi:hypothetical protein
MNIENYAVKNDELDYLIVQNINVSILVALFPFLLNTPWSSNVFVILGSILTRIVVVQDSSFSTIFSLIVNFSVAWSLLITHFLKFYFQPEVDEKEKNQ